MSDAGRRRLQLDTDLDFGLISEWCDAWGLIEHLQLGDLVEFDRDGFFQHWGVYIGKDDNDQTGTPLIVHLASNDVDDGIAASTTGGLLCRSTSMRSVSGKINSSIQGRCPAEVRCEDLFEVAENSRCRVNNLRDKDAAVLPIREIVERATGQLGCQKYNILFTNCEHFSTWCRYGSKYSEQACRFTWLALGGYLVGAGMVVSGSAGAGLAAAAATYSLCRVLSGRRRSRSTAHPYHRPQPRRDHTW